MKMPLKLLKKKENKFIKSLSKFFKFCLSYHHIISRTIKDDSGYLVINYFRLKKGAQQKNLVNV